MNTILSPRYSIFALATAFGLLAFGSSSAFAWSGGPFKVGPGPLKSYDGTYKASVVGKNLIGVLVINSTGTSATGTSTFYADGMFYSGSAVMAVEPATKSVAGTFSATGSRSATSSRVSTNSQTITVNSTATTNGTSTTGTSTANDSGALAGGFIGTVKSRGGYSLVFSGRGKATLDYANDNGTGVKFQSIPIRVAGSRTSFPTF